LKPDEVVTVGSLVLLPKLNDRISPAACSRIVQSRRLHRPEAKSILASPGSLFDGQAAFEVRRFVFLDMWLVGFRPQQRFDERLVLLFVEWAIDVIVRAVEGFAIARCTERKRHVDGIGSNDGADAVVKEET